MNNTLKWKMVGYMAFFTWALLSCKNDLLESISSTVDEPDTSFKSTSTDIAFDPTDVFDVFFAQTHVLRPSDEYFGLVSERPALIKVNLTGEPEEASPMVTATLTLYEKGDTLIHLVGPDMLPISLDLRPGKVEHSFDDSFTETIPGSWIKPGLKVHITAGDKRVTFDKLEIGAPNRMVMNMFDVHYFQDIPSAYESDEWLKEVEAKLPTAGIELRRQKMVFPELTIPPWGGYKAIRLLQLKDYWDSTGVVIDGEQDAAIQWKDALRDAAGTNSGRRQLFFVNYYGNRRARGGRAGIGAYSGVCNGRELGSRFHELGHALSLPHADNNPDYPYRGDMYGKKAPWVQGKVHVGPNWAYDQKRKVFISPFMQRKTAKGNIGDYKVDPMRGGGSSTQDHGFLLNHFSDYSVDAIRSFLQGHIIQWNDALGSYARWDWNSRSYSNITPNQDLDINVDVISVMAGASSTTPQAHVVYPPIGPYKSGIREIYDPTQAEDRIRAAQNYCPSGGCDVSVRVVQGGRTKVYMLPIHLDPTLAPSDYESFNTRAINLRASEGAVTKIELLATPDAEQEGLPTAPTVLRTWQE